MSIQRNDDEVIELVKRYLILKLDDETIVKYILNETGIVVSFTDLKKYKTIAKREKYESKRELDKYMKDMLEIGMFNSVRKQNDMTEIMIDKNFKSFLKAAENNDMPNQIAFTQILHKEFEDQRKISTSMGYLTKTREILEKGLQDKEAGETTSILVETKPGDQLDETIQNSMSEIELNDNRVA